MLSLRRSAGLNVKKFFVYLVLGLIADILSGLLLSLFDLLNILNLSSESILNVNFLFIRTICILHIITFAVIGIISTLYGFFICSRSQKAHTLAQFIFIKVEFSLVAWFILLYTYFFDFNIGRIWNVRIDPYAALFIALGIALLLFSLLSSFRTTKKVRYPLYAFRLFFLILIIPLFLYLVKVNISLSLHGPEKRPEAVQAVQPGSTEALNVLLISIDTCRADKLSCYGFDLETSPNIDSLAENGFVFEYAFSTSNWTRPSMASLFTSVYPGTHQTERLAQRIPDALWCLPERFKNAGYHTAVFSANDNVSPDFGFDQGVDLFYETVKKSLLQYSGLYHKLRKLIPALGPVLRRYSKQKMISRQLSPEEALQDRFTKWRQSIGDETFLANIHFNTPHAPYKPPPEYDIFMEDPAIKVKRRSPDRKLKLSGPERERFISYYYGEIHYVDFLIGEIIDGLKEADILDKTIIVITSDHGEEFYDHQGWGHSHTLYNELIHVPLIFYIPNSPYPPARIKNHVSIIDVGPTVLSLAGLPGDPFMDGKDLTPLMQGEGEDVHDYIFSQFVGVKDEIAQFAVIHGGYKYIESNMPSEQAELLFHFDDDFKEENQLALDAIPEYPYLKDYLDRIKAYTLQKKMDAQDVVISEERRERLKALGYLQ